jgi:TolA-binding protein
VAIVTERSFDAYMWQTVERKLRFIQQIMRADLDRRDVEDIGSDEVNLFARTKAIATGNPLLLDQAEAQDQVAKLRRLSQAHTAGQNRLRWQVDQYQKQIRQHQRDITTLEGLVGRSRDTSADRFTMTVMGHTTTNRAEAAQLLAQAVIPAGRMYVYQTHEYVAELGGQVIDVYHGPAAFRFSVAGSHDTAIVDVPTDNRDDIGTPGMIVRLENMIRKMPTQIERARDQIEQLTGKIRDTQALVGRPFAQAAELAAAEARYQMITAQLATTADQDSLATDRDEPTGSTSPTTGQPANGISAAAACFPTGPQATARRPTPHQTASRFDPHQPDPGLER